MTGLPLLFFIVGVTGFLIGATLLIVESAIQRRLQKRCTAMANGKYMGPEFVTIGSGKDRETVQYERVEFYANGETINARLDVARGFTLRTPEGAQVVVHYDPSNPRKCWGHLPGAEDKKSIWPRISAVIGVAGLVGWALMTLL